MPGTHVNYDRPKLRRLRAAYEKAVAAGASQFDFEGAELLVSYARYLIEYLEGALPKD
jgi:hypothetical protein